MLCETKTKKKNLLKKFFISNEMEYKFISIRLYFYRHIKFQLHYAFRK